MQSFQYLHVTIDECEAYPIYSDRSKLGLSSLGHLVSFVKKGKASSPDYE